MSENYEVGCIVEGKVVKVKPFGAIVSLGNGMQGLVHISQISSSFVENIDDHISDGEEVKVKILSINEENKKIALSIKEVNPVVPAKPSFKPRDKEQRYDNRNNNQSNSSGSSSQGDFEDKMKEWLKQSNERQANLNKRANKR